MDDAHIFCTPDQLVDELLEVFDMTLEVHRTFGFEEPRIELSTKPGEAIGDESMWERATEALRAALDKSGMEYEVAEGEGAFYGPKVDFHFKDAIGRSWQLTTVQCDFALPERFDLEARGVRGGGRGAAAGGGAAGRGRREPRDPEQVRDAQLQKVPYVLVVGDKEQEVGSVAVRDRAGTEKRGVPLETFLARAIDESKSRALETGDMEDLG